VHSTNYSIGWIGTGRMGFAMAKRLLDAGCDVSVYNRTRAKAEPLSEYGAEIVDTPTELSHCDIVFTMVSGPDDLLAVSIGETGVLIGTSAPKLLVDCSSVSEAASAKVREEARARGTAMLAAPVSGNAKVVKSGQLTFAVSGPQEWFERVNPYFDIMGRSATYVGEGELARMVKVCHNLMLGAVTQTLAEITVLAEKGGVPRHAFLAFLNTSVMGSMFSRYKGPAFVNLDMTPTFTLELLRKDLDLGLAAGRALGVPLPVTELTRGFVQRAIDAGHDGRDFAVLLEEQAKASGLQLKPEDVVVDDGLSHR
jgi:3-hydroxyisobutyrate dehydrogenase